MVDLPGIDLNVRTIQLGTSDRADVDVGVSRSSIDVNVATPVAGVTLHLGLDRLLHSTSPIDRLLHSPDPLARFRAGNLPADPSPVMTKGMTARVGDIHAEIATRHDIGGMRATETTGTRTATTSGTDTLLAARAAVGADTRGVGAVRDAVEAAALPQRINGPAGASAGERGLQVGAAFGTMAAGATVSTAPAVSVSFHGLVNVLDQAGAPLATARDAPLGAVLVYARPDGSNVAELRVAGGFANANALSVLPLTGAAPARVGEGVTLSGVFVRADAPAATVPLVAGSAVLASAGDAPGAGRVAADANASQAVPPPDGSTIPAGHPAVASEARQGFDDGAPNADATDRPYIHAIWYDILAMRFEAAGVALLERSTALRDVVWATAMEHGPFAAADGSDVLSRVAEQIDLAQADDGAIIAALYAERGRVEDSGLAHYPEVLPFDQDRVVARLADEAEQAARRIVTA